MANVIEEIEAQIAEVKTAAIRQNKRVSDGNIVTISQTMYLSGMVVIISVHKIRPPVSSFADNRQLSSRFPPFPLFRGLLYHLGRTDGRLLIPATFLWNTHQQHTF
jgi:hypothetical protein